MDIVTQDPNRGKIRTYAELNQYILADNDGLIHCYRLWLLCRSLDDGSGVISLDLLESAMDDISLGQRTFKRIKNSTHSAKFLEFQKNKVYYRSLQSVCESLLIAPGKPVSIPISTLSEIGTFKAYLYAAWFAANPHTTISRERLTALFGISESTQRRWEQIAGIDVHHNIVEVDQSKENAAAPHFPTDGRSTNDRLGRVYTWEYKGKICYRTVNTYSAVNLDRDRTGNTRSIGKYINALPAKKCGGGTVQANRIFYTPQNLPNGYQEAHRGATLRTDNRIITTTPERGYSRVWTFHSTRPVTRNTAIC